MRISLLLLTLVFFFITTRASADETSDLRKRIEQLEAAVEELTLQLADSVRERRQLEAQLAEADAAAEAAAATLTATAAAASTPAAASTGPVTSTASQELIEETAVSAEAAIDAPIATSKTPSTPKTSKESAAVAEYASIGSTDCDVSQALAGYDGKRKGNEALAAWLGADDHLARCSTEQLREIRDAVKWDWLGYEKPLLKLLDKELARR